MANFSKTVLLQIYFVYHLKSMKYPVELSLKPCIEHVSSNVPILNML